MPMQFNVTFDPTAQEDRILLAQILGLVPPPGAMEQVLEKIAQKPEAAAPVDPVKAARQEAAAKARAAKAAKAAGDPPPPPAEDAAGPDDANGQDQDDDLGMSSQAASMSLGEAHDAALALVREIYAANKVAEVKALQKTWGVQKFYDVPLDKAYDFYASAMKVAQQTGLRR